MKYADSKNYTLGIDCYPSGIFAAVACEGKVKEVFTLECDNEPIVSITERTRSAIYQAEQLLGKAPDNISLACIDDGSDGSELESIVQAWGCNVETSSFAHTIDEFVNKLEEQPSADNVTLSAIRATQTATLNSDY